MIQNAAKYGLIIGLIGIITIMIQYFAGTLTQQGILSYLFLAVYLVLIYYYGTIIRAEAGGFIRYWQAWKLLAVMTVMASVIYAVFLFLLFNVIDPQYGIIYTQTVKAIAADQIEKMSSLMGEEASEKALESINEQDYIGITAMLTNILSFSGLSLMLCFIFAAIIRKSDPDAYLKS